ncbi:MAG: glutamyl-tRNA reductase [Anaerolineae bacterium]
MHFIAIGLNHKTAPVHLREQVSFTSATLCAFLNRLKLPQNGASPPAGTILHETVILSTCNRLEYFAVTPHPEAGVEEIIARLSDTFGVAAETFRPHLYILRDDAVVEHLMRVAAGLDSMVLGEAQILGQVVTAYQTAAAHHTAGPFLCRLFERAIHAGKRARTETGIGLNPASISSVAVQLARRHLGGLAGKTVMILGAGEMGTLAMKVLVNEGVGQLLIVNRTRQRAVTIAERWNAEPYTFDDMPTALARADLVIASTAAPHAVLRKPQVAQAVAARPDRPLLIVDIALPRDVEPDVADLPNVHLHNLDHLQAQIAENLKAREQEIPNVEAILAEETAAFLHWQRSLGVKPTITTFRRQFDALRRQELERALNRLTNLSQREQKIVTELSHRLMNKFLHPPTARLRAEAANGNGFLYAKALHELFALEAGSQEAGNGKQGLRN